MTRLLSVAVVLLALVVPNVVLPSVQAGIVLDYRHADGTFLDENPGSASYNAAARAAVNAAAADINSVLSLNLAAISSTQTVTGTIPGVFDTNANISLGGNYTNPTTGIGTTISIPLAANEIRIFVGTQALSGSTLGIGGFSTGGSFGGGGIESNWVDAVAAANAEGAAVFSRGDGPTMGTLTGTLTLGATPATFDTPVGPTLGNLSFDDDASTNWHFDHTTAVAAGTSDLYSVALHEILHSIGVGASQSWDDLVSGQDWLGSEVIALAGTGDDLINAGGDHIEFGVMSTRISDGMMQEVVMDPNITQGTRKSLTQLDLAFLRDIGFDANSVSAVPEPGSFLALSLIGFGSFAFRRRRAA